MERRIIHIDMDAFYASVEQRDNPGLRGRPVAVGHHGKRGVVAAASYEARKYGIHSAMASVTAAKMCDELVFVEPRFDVYRAVSQQIHTIFHEYTDIIEPISLDEAFLDVTANKKGIELAVDIAREIKKRIRDDLNLVASAGVSCNKFLAKVASDYRKPDGLFVIHPSQAERFVATLPIEDFWGVGPVTARRMHQMGVHTGADLRQLSLDALVSAFGKIGRTYYDFSRGIDNRPVEAERRRVSVGCELTLDDDMTGTEELHSVIRELAAELVGRMSRKQFSGRTLTLKIKHADFTQHSRSRSASEPTAWNIGSIESTAAELLESIDYRNNAVRLVGLSISHPFTSPSSDNDEYYGQLTFDLF